MTEFTKPGVRTLHRRIAVMRYKEVKPVESEDFLKRVVEAWYATKSPLGYTAYTSVQNYTHLSYNTIFGVLKWLHITRPYAVIFNVDRMGKNVFFKLVPAKLAKNSISNPLTKAEKVEIKDLANVQYAISKHYDYDPVKSSFWKGRSVGMGKIAQRYNPHWLKKYAKQHGGTYTREVLSNGFILHRVTVPGTLKSNPVLEALAPAVVTGAGIAIGFKGIDWLAKKMGRRNPDMTIYCVKCRKKVVPMNVVVVRLPAGRSKVAMKAYRGICPYCQIGIYRIIGRA